jgi:regulation of enolase protein 1 (concanavalin A-like superfamily)/fibronectin type 3 domain-containing protein
MPTSRSASRRSAPAFGEPARDVDRNLQPLEHRRLMTASSVSLPYRLDFDGDAGGLVDANGTGTGFTEVQANANGDGHQANLLEITNGRLDLTSLAGNDGGNSRSDDSLVNALQVGFDASDDFIVEARLTGNGGTLGFLDARYEQAGILLGGDSDGFVKIVALHHDAGPRLQFIDEWSDGSGGFESSAPSTNSDGLIFAANWSSTSTLDLRLIGDPDAGTVSAQFRVDGGVWRDTPHTLTVPQAHRAAFFGTDGAAGVIAFHKNTDSTRGFTASYDHFEVSRPATPVLESPSVVASRPNASATDVKRDAFVAVDVRLPNGAIDPTTVTPASVYLLDTIDNRVVPAAVTVSGGGDAITLTPSQLLLADRAYEFVVTSAVTDVAGASFASHTTRFTTGSSVAASAPEVAFDRQIQASTVGIAWTGLSFGPDGRLFGTTADGKIYAMTPGVDGTLPTPTLLYDFQAETGEQRLITGMTFDADAATPTAYVSHGHYVDPANTSNRDAPAWSGTITRLTGADLDVAQDVIIDIPRSVYDHLNNQPVFGPDGRLYFAVPSNTAMGAPDSTWGNRPERLMTAAILAADVRTISSPLSIKTEDGGSYDPYAAGAKVTIYATGIRNVYDLVWTSGGHLFAPANGSAAGGNTPAGPGVPAINGVNQTQHDLLHRVEAGNYYGHPNALRGEYVLYGGNPTAGADVLQVDQYPVGVTPPSNYGGFAYDFGLNVSPNGVLQYDSNGQHFGGALDGKLIVSRYSGGDDLVFLEIDESTGDVTGAFTGSFGATGLLDPLDVVQDPATGNLYVAEAGFRSGGGNGLRISLLSPIQAAPLAVTAPSRDYGGGETLFFSDTISDGTSPAFTINLAHNGSTGSVAFAADAFTIRGSNAGLFRIVSADASGTTLGLGESRDLQIVFDADAVGIFEAELVIKSNDPSAPERILQLRGLGTAGEGGQLEPSLQRILDLYGLQVDVGDPDADTTLYPDTTSVAGSSEVTIPLFKAADADQPVTIEVLGVMGTAFDNAFSETIELLHYAEGDFGNLVRLFGIDKSQAQTVQATPTGTTSFSPAGSFGLAMRANDFGPRVSYSQDELNTWDDADERRKVRVFPLIDAAGNAVPDAYVVAFEEWEQESDQNDLIVIVHNVDPAAEAEMRLENLSPLPGSDRLIFNRIERPDQYVPNAVHDTNTLRLHNDGSGPMTISSLATDTGDFVITSGGTNSGPIVVPAGGFHDVEVRFVHSDTDSTWVKQVTGTLTIVSDDATQPARDIVLSGLWQSHSEQGDTGTSQEGSLYDIVRAFGYTTDVGPNTGLSNYDTGTNTEGRIEAVGEETISAFWQKAGAGEVRVVQLAAFHQQRDPFWFGTGRPRYIPSTTLNWYAGNDPINSTTYNKVFKHADDAGQSFLPLDESGTGYADNTFDPGDVAFGLSVDQMWHSDPNRNEDHTPGNTIDESGQHSFRWFVLRDADGNVVPNAYLIGQDNVGSGGDLHTGGRNRGANFDHQDNVYVVFNVKPVDGPSAVDGTTAVGGSGGNTVTWDANSEGNVAGYNVYRSTSEAGGYTIVSAQIDGTSYTDFSAAPSQQYFYRVAAVDYHGTEGAVGAPASATRPSTNATPVAAQNAAAVATSPTSITLTWFDAATNESGYRVERATGTGDFAVVTTLMSGRDRFEDTGLSGSTLYRYRVIAFNGNGDAAPATAQATTSADLSAPTNVAATATSASNVRLSWTDASQNEITFRVQRAAVDGSFSTVATLPSGTTTYNDSVAPESTWRYRVIAVGTNGNTGPASEEATATTPADPSVVADVENLRLTGVAHDRVSIAWDHDGGTLAGGFEVQRRTGGGPWTTAATLSDPATRAYQDADVSPTTTYEYRVRAFNVSGATRYDGGFTASITATTTRDAADLAAPTGLTAEVVSREQVDLAWQPVDLATRYVLERRPDGAGTWQVLADQLTTPTYIDAGVLPDVAYDYRVRAANAQNPTAGPYSTIASVTTPAADAIVGTAIGTATGSQSGDGLDLTLTATGTGTATDLGETDHLFFSHRLYVGDFDVAVRIDSLEGASPASAAGLMVRSDLSGGAVNAFLRYSDSPAGGEVAMSWRDSAGSETRSPAGRRDEAAPVWLRLVREGSSVRGLTSSDGRTWTAVAQVDGLPLSSGVRVGAAVASYSADATTADFHNLNAYAQPLPDQPSDLSASPSDDEVTLTWTAPVAGATEVSVERRPEGASVWTQVATLAADAGSYTDSDVAPGVGYDYRIIASNAAGEAPSTTVFVRTVDARPDAPNGGAAPTASANDAGKGVQLSLPAATPDVTSFQVERRTAGGSWETLARVPSSSAGINDVSARPGTTYEYRIVAMSDAGASEPTQAVSMTTPTTAAVPSQPTAAAAEAGVAWGDGGETPESWRVQRRIGGGDWIDLGTLPGNVLTMTDPAGQGTSAEYRVRGETGNSIGAWSATLRAAEQTAGAMRIDLVGGVSGSAEVVRDFEHIDVRVTGGDVWSFADEAVFVGRSVTGDFDVAVRVTGIDGNATGGLMARSSAEAGAANVFLKKRAQDVRVTTRASTDGLTSVVGTDNSAASWLRLTRRGEVVVASASADGTTWTEVGRSRMTADSVRLGVAATGGGGETADVRFREFRSIASTASTLLESLFAA